MRKVLLQVLAALVQFAEQLREGFKRVRDLYVEVMSALDRTVGWLKVRRKTLAGARVHRKALA